MTMCYCARCGSEIHISRLYGLPLSADLFCELYICEKCRKELCSEEADTLKQITCAWHRFIDEVARKDWKRR